MEALKIALDRAGVEPVAVGLVLGSGLAGVADLVEGVSIPYAELPGFPHAGVSGHKAALIVGRLEGVRVAAVSTITNMGAGLSDEAISHEHTKAMAPLGAAKFERVLRRYLRGLA